MREPVTIKRIDPDRDPGSYASLRRAGIEHVQALSGNDWTDYNVHDPGVTILEQLCYQLSELIYRSDFPVEDFICGGDGSLNLARQGLVAPHDIFPSRPTTASDLRKVIVSSVADLDNAWIDVAPDGLTLVSISIRPDAIRRQDTILNQVRKICYQNRNLCEDIRHDIVLISRLSCSLHADIEVSREDRLPKILGEVYFLVSRHIAGGLRYGSFRRAVDAGMSFEKIYSGPLLANGMVSDESIEATGNPVQIADVLSLVRKIEGIERIDDLYLCVNGRVHRESLSRVEGDTYLSLSLPNAESSEFGITPRANGRELPIPTSAVLRCLDELLYSDETSQRSPKSIRSLHRIPTGQHREFGQYTSVQEQLPPLYGINKFGNVSSRRPAQRARLRQLKAFLLIFDQIMADFAAGLADVGNLFSIDQSIDRSFSCQPIGDDIVANSEDLYNSSQPQFLEKLTREGDHFAARRNRVLNHLLALYGESFPDNGLRSCASYESDDELPGEIAKRKLAFLKNISWLTRNRGAAFDYSRPSWKTLNLSGLQARLSLLLNLSEAQVRSLVRPLLDLHVRPIPHGNYLESRAGQVAVVDIEIDDTFGQIPKTLHQGSASLKELRARARALSVFQGQRLSDALLQRGTQLSNFRYGPLPNNPGQHLVFQPTPESRWWLVASANDERECVELAHGLRSLLAILNQHCEGMHLIEHVLLRPSQTGNDASPTRVTNDRSFTNGRITVVLPDWTLRFQDPGFRLLANELVRINCPAHVSPEILWLSYTEMYRFEGLFKLWLKKRSERLQGSAEIDDIADELALFIVTRQDYAPDSGGMRRYV